MTKPVKWKRLCVEVGAGESFDNMGGVHIDVNFPASPYVDYEYELVDYLTSKVREWEMQKRLDSKQEDTSHQ